MPGTTAQPGRRPRQAGMKGARVRNDRPGCCLPGLGEETLRRGDVCWPQLSGVADRMRGGDFSMTISLVTSDPELSELCREILAEVPDLGTSWTVVPVSPTDGWRD